MTPFHGALLLTVGLLAGCTNSPTPVTSGSTTTPAARLPATSVDPLASTAPAGAEPAAPGTTATTTVELTASVCEADPTTEPDATFCDRLANEAPALIASLTADNPDLYTPDQLVCIANHYAQLPEADINHILTSIFDHSSPSAIEATEIIDTMFATCDAPTPPAQ